MTRIVAGAARGRRLAVPDGRRTRPTSDRAREGLFSTLESLLGSLSGRSFADLYAGSGAVGLEALSRGATRVLFVEQDARAAQVVRDNVALLGLPGAVVLASPVERVVSVAAGTAYDVLFLDPPYETSADALARVVATALHNGWLAPGAVVVVERASRDRPWVWPEGFTAERTRRYGEGTLWYGLAASHTDEHRTGPRPPGAGE